MALHVALNKTPAGNNAKDNCCCCVDEDKCYDFTLNNMLEIQEEVEDVNKSIEEIKCKINCALREVAYVAGCRSITFVFGTKSLVATDFNRRGIVVRDFTAEDAEKIAAWLRNNGYSVDVNMFDSPHGVIFGSILVYWR